MRTTAFFAGNIAYDIFEITASVEPISSLDVSLQADIIHLLKKLQEERGLSLLLISHDLPMVEHISDRIVKLQRE